MYPLRSRNIFTLRRVAALAVIAAVAIGLGYLRLAPGPASLTVPPDARSGELSLKPCTFSTESGDIAAECGVLVVPEIRTNPALRLIALPVTRIKTTSARPGEPVFYLEGGPGLSNMRLPQASRFIQDRDLVLVGYRGIDSSVRLDCPEVGAALKRSADLLSETSFRAYGAAYRACADRLTAAGIDLAGYGLPQQVDDLEAARTALGYDRISLLSQSAGTRTAMIYAWRYPERIHRSVMIAVNPPGHFFWDPQTMDEQIARYAELCRQDAACSGRTNDLADLMQRTSADMPGRWLFLPINASNVLIFAYFGLMESTQKQMPLSAPMTLDAWLSAAEGDASGLWMQALVGGLFPLPFVWGQYAAAGTLDAADARAYFSAGNLDHHNLGWVGSAYAWGGGSMADNWPASPDGDAYRHVRTSNVETLLIGGALDTATPPQVATKELLPFLPNGHQVVLPGFGHVGSFFSEQPEAGSRLINAFFASGRVDDSLYQPQKVDFTPQPTFTYAAKLLLGVMIAVASLAMLSLIWMAVRLRRRGAFGIGVSAPLRSVWPVLLGLGGWFFGVLIVLTAWPSLPIDDERLAVLAIGLPIGAGITLAWLNPARARSRNMAGAVLAVVAALAGAWLGFHATEDLPAVLTAIAAAVATANLALICLDSTSIGVAQATNKTSLPADIPGRVAPHA